MGGPQAWSEFFSKRQTQRELGTQSHGTLEVSRATERRTSTAMSGPAPRTGSAGEPGTTTTIEATARQARGSRTHPYRIVLLGSYALVADGVRSHESGLVGCLARSIAAITGHGATVDLLTTPPAVGEDRLLRQVDALVLVLQAPPDLPAPSAEMRQAR